MGKRTCLIFFSAVLALSASCGFIYGEKLDKIAAIVNGDVITEDEVGTFMKLTDMAEESGLPTNDPKKLRLELLNRMVEDRLILQEAQEMGLKADEKVVEDRIKDIKMRAGSELAFDMALKQQGFSLSELRKKLRNQLLIFMAVQKEVKSKVLVSPKEVTDYYESNRSQFISPESVSVDSIFVKDKEDLSKVEALLSEGKDFNEVAREYSQKSNLGTIARGQLKKELEDVLFSLETGVCSIPVSVENGFYIFLLKEKMPVSERSIDEVKNTIALMLEDQKTEKKLKEWLEALKDKAYISVREE
ncbi:MAG: peptidyl-prolyl cis-trans isomerase [Candidatus Omnitrophica bacterium]|nr:peptidyl-prolyl cis-trans isomerase [Candidatus Omnitrophota bacterium]